MPRIEEGIDFIRKNLSRRSDAVLRRDVVQAHRRDQPLLVIDAEDIGMAIEIDLVDQDRLLVEMHDGARLVSFVADAGDVFHVLARLDAAVLDPVEQPQKLVRKAVGRRLYAGHCPRILDCKSTGSHCAATITIVDIRQFV
jgi:hypothetical protein